MDADWRLRFIKRFAKAANIENWDGYTVAEVRALLEQLRETNNTLFSIINHYLIYADEYDKAKNDSKTAHSNPRTYVANLRTAERDYHKTFNSMAVFCSQNGINIKDLFTTQHVNTPRFEKGNLVRYKMLVTGVYNVYGTWLDPENGKYPDDGFDYIIGRIDIADGQDVRYQVTEDQLTPYT